VHPVSEDETALASADAGFGVALAGAVVRGSLAVGVYVGAVDGDDFGLHRPSLARAQGEFPLSLGARVDTWECFSLPSYVHISLYLLKSMFTYGK